VICNGTTPTDLSYWSISRDALREDIAESYDELTTSSGSEPPTRRMALSRQFAIEARLARLSASPLEGHTNNQATFCAASRRRSRRSPPRWTPRACTHRLYPDQVKLQAQGRKLCEFTRLASMNGVRSQAILGAIFHVACIS
jgi:hypothetical protein